LTSFELSGNIAIFGLGTVQLKFIDLDSHIKIMHWYFQV